MRKITGRTIFLRHSCLGGKSLHTRNFAEKLGICAKSGNWSGSRRRSSANQKTYANSKSEEIWPIASSEERSDEKIRLEAFLFLSREPIAAKKLAQILGLKDVHHVVDLIHSLNHSYDMEQRTFRILEFAGGYQYRVRPQFTPWLRRLCRHEHVDNQESPEIQLSPPAMETLAIIAYRQPVIRSEIESIRGVQCAELLRLLLEKNLIRIAGCSSELGRPRLYRTTQKFLEVFGLKTLAQLPSLMPD